MKDTYRGLRSESPEERAILLSGQFTRVLKEYCQIEAKVAIDGNDAIFESTNPSEIGLARQLVTEISEVKLEDRGDCAAHLK